MSTRRRGRPVNLLRQAAREQGHRTYVSRDPCYVCDGVERYTSNGACVTCAVERGCARYQEKREQISEYDRLRYASMSPGQRERALAYYRARHVNMPLKDRERQRLRGKRYHWIARRLVQMAKDDGVYAALKDQYREQQPKSRFGEWSRRRLMLMARDDGVYDILKTQSLTANLEK